MEACQKDRGGNLKEPPLVESVVVLSIKIKNHNTELLSKE